MNVDFVLESDMALSLPLSHLGLTYTGRSIIANLQMRKWRLGDGSAVSVQAGIPTQMCVALYPAVCQVAIRESNSLLLFSPPRLPGQGASHLKGLA